MDDTILSKAEAGYAKSAEYGVFAEKPGALVGAGSPRFLVSPFNPDAPVEGGISGAAKGALAGFVPFGVPSGSGSPSSPSKHDGIGVSGRSQAHETLKTMTTIIMRDAEDWLRGVVDARAASADSAAVDSATAVPIALIYLDPARRDAHGGRTYAIADCTPDVLALKDRLLAVSTHVMVKLSPMLDWRKTVADFNGSVGEVHIVSTGNECKELLLVLDRGSHDAVRVICVNDGDVFGYVHDMKTGADSDGVVLASAGEKGSQGGSAEPSHAAPEQPRYLYEPNASLMKGGCFALLEDHYGMRQIGPNSHLLISGTPSPQFPGRGFVIETIAGMGKKELKRALAGVDRANIAVRNFPLTAVQLRRKLKLADGGDVYLFGTTSVDGRHVIVRTVKQ